MKGKEYKLIDLFAGVGGISTGFEWAGFRTVFANEFDKQIGEAFRLNFPNVPVLISDIRELNFEKIMNEFEIHPGDIDVIAGGPPCQGFSMANRKKIELDNRNLLFLEFVRAVKAFSPKCFLIENVMGMTSEAVSIDSEERMVVDSMTEYFEDLGYHISFKGFKSEEHGVPQIRRRVIIIGTNIHHKKKDLTYGKIGNIKKGYLNKEQYTKVINRQKELFEVEEQMLRPPITVWDALSDLPPLNAGEGFPEMEYLTGPNNDYQRMMRKGSNKVYNHISTPHSDAVIDRILRIDEGQNFRDLPIELQTKSVHSGAYGRLGSDSLSPTITTRFDTPSTGRVIHPFQNRTITVREAARLQSFPDHFKFSGTRTSQGKQVGNAVPPLVAKAIAEMFISDFLTENTYGPPKRKSRSKNEVF